jgi:Putative auto-transporter adhesin, head GIN domain
LQPVARGVTGAVRSGIVAPSSTHEDSSMMQANRRLTLALLATAAGLGSAQAAPLTGSGNPATETRAVTGFQAISMRGGIDLVVRQGSSEGVQVRADDNLLALVQTVVEGSGSTRTLRIQFKPGESLRAKTPIVVTVDVVQLSALASSGSGDIHIGALKTPALSLSLAGSSDATLEGLETEQLSISIAGSGDVQARGRATRLEISIAGSGDVQAHELAAGDVSISIAGSGDARVMAQKTLGVSIAGSGDVQYSGAATVTRSSILGSGTVRKRQP